MPRKSPAFSFYPDSFLSAVSRWSFEQRGVYITLLGDQWVNGGFSREQASVICAGARAEVVDFVLAAKFDKDKTGGFLNSRLEEERSKQEKNSKRQSENGKKGGRPKKEEKPKRKPSESQTQTQTKAKKKPSDSDSDSDSDSKDTHTAESVVEYFNESFGTRSTLTASRKAKLKTRLAEKSWRENWRHAIDKGKTSEFLLGSGPTGWKMDIDFFIKPDSVAKILEGKYDSNEKSKPGQQTIESIKSNEARMIARQAEQRRAARAKLEASQ